MRIRELLETESEKTPAQRVLDAVPTPNPGEKSKDKRLKKQRLARLKIETGKV